MKCIILERLCHNATKILLGQCVAIVIHSIGKLCANSSFAMPHDGRAFIGDGPHLSNEVAATADGEEAEEAGDGPHLSNEVTATADGEEAYLSEVQTRARTAVDLSEVQTRAASARSQPERPRETTSDQNTHTAAQHRRVSNYTWVPFEGTSGGEEHFIVDFNEDCLCIWNLKSQNQAYEKENE